MSTNKKLLEYAEYKGLSQRKFTNSLNLSEGVLRKGKNIGSGYLKRIKEKYPDLNLHWLLFDEGEMILDQRSKVNESAEEYQKSLMALERLEMELEHVKELLLAKNETIQVLKEQLDYLRKLG